MHRRVFQVRHGVAALIKLFHRKQSLPILLWARSI